MSLSNASVQNAINLVAEGGAKLDREIHRADGIVSRDRELHAALVEVACALSAVAGVLRTLDERTRGLAR